MPRRTLIPTAAEIRHAGNSTKRRRQILERAQRAPQLAALAKDVIPFHMVKPILFGPTLSAGIPDAGARMWVFTTERYAQRFRDDFKELLK